MSKRKIMNGEKKGVPTRKAPQNRYKVSPEAVHELQIKLNDFRDPSDRPLSEGVKQEFLRNFCRQIKKGRLTDSLI